MRQTVESFTSGYPVFDAKQGITTLGGGFLLVVTGLVAGSIIPAGSAFVADEITRTATLQKTTLVFANATNTATAYQVTKGTQFKAGDFITKATGVKSIDITSIDYSNAGYDIINTSATLGYALTAGDKLVQATSASATAALLKPNGLLYNDTFVVTNTTVTLVNGCVVFVRRIPPILDESKTGLPNVIFSNSK